MGNKEQGEKFKPPPSFRTCFGIGSDFETNPETDPEINSG
jgi:hypothetical protein